MDATRGASGKGGQAEPPVCGKKCVPHNRYCQLYANSRTEKINKKEILEKCPDISKKTVERALADLLSKGLIQKTGAGPATGYVWVQK